MSAVVLMIVGGSFAAAALIGLWVALLATALPLSPTVSNRHPVSERR
jgi:hypothetical protein